MCHPAQMGTLSSDKCSKPEAERAALTATASSAAPFALNRDSVRKQAVAQAASSAGGGVAAAAQQSDGSQADAMAAAGDEMQIVLPEQETQPHTRPRQAGEQAAAESKLSGAAAEQVPDGQQADVISAVGQVLAGASQTDPAAAARESAQARTSAESIATDAQPQAEPVDTNGAKWDSEAAADTATQPAETQPATSSLMLGSREVRPQKPRSEASGANVAADSSQPQSIEAEARRLAR